MNDILQSVLLNVNALVCTVSAVWVFAWRILHRPASLIQSVAIYLRIISCAAVSIRILTLTGDYLCTDWSETIINSAFCLFCLLKAGNLFERRKA